MNVVSVAVLIPVLDRPHRVKPLLASLHESVEHERATGWEIQIVFVASPGDLAELAALEACDAPTLVVPWLPGPADYARKINYAAHVDQADWYFTGADDLVFHPGWLTACLDRHQETGALVIGTNDLHNPSVKNGMYATHLLVHRDYIERGTVDEPGKIFTEAYSHNCVDTEAVETAKARGMFAFAAGAHVEHLHPTWRGAPDDATYRKGKAHHKEDRVLLAQRRALWTRTAVERRRVRLSARMR